MRVKTPYTKNSSYDKRPDDGKLNDLHSRSTLKFTLKQGHFSPFCARFGGLGTSGLKCHSLYTQHAAYVAHNTEKTFND